MRFVAFWQFGSSHRFCVNLTPVLWRQVPPVTSLVLFVLLLSTKQRRKEACTAGRL